jgi:hypothetical protein
VSKSKQNRTQTLSAGALLCVGPLTLLPIERVVTYLDMTNMRIWISVCKDVYAIIFRESSGLHAVDTDGMAVSLDRLLEKVPGLGTRLVTL